MKKFLSALELCLSGVFFFFSVFLIDGCVNCEALKCIYKEMGFFVLKKKGNRFLGKKGNGVDWRKKRPSIFLSIADRALIIFPPKDT